MSSTLLQILLLLTVFSIGVCSVLAAQYALAHYRPHPAARPAKRRSDSEARLTPEARQHLQQQSEARFQAVMEHTAASLQHDLQSTAEQLNKVLQKIGNEVVGNEMERYRLQLEQIRKQADGAIGGAQAEVNKHQAILLAHLEEEHASLRAKMIEDIDKEKQRLVQEILAEKQHLGQQIDDRLADAVASFLIETLGHEVDLGAQQKYLTAMLEEHKADFKRSLSDEA